MKFNQIFAALVIFTIIAAISSLTKRRRMRSLYKYRNYAPNQAYPLSTNLDADGDGNVFYLDRQDVDCQGGAMSYFRLQRNSGHTKIKYDFTCAKSDAITNTPDVKYTPWNDTDSNKKKSVNYLDRHDMNCPNGTVIGEFRMQRSDNGRGNQIRYKYTCLPAQTVCCSQAKLSDKEAMGNRSIVYLDRQKIGNRDSANIVLSRLWLRTSYSPDEMWYLYEQCQLSDLDTLNAIKADEAKEQQLTANLQTAKDEAKGLKEQQKQLQEQMAQLQAQMQQNAAAIDAADAKVDALDGQVNDAKNNLQNLKATPSLACSLN